MRTARPLDEVYFNWLCAKTVLRSAPDADVRYTKLFRHLYCTTFTWFVDYDENRAKDGIELREEFLRETCSDVDYDWLDLDCSIFEMILGLADRISFGTDRESASWFWEIVDNLGLSLYTDNIYNKGIAPQREVYEILDNLVNRKYDSDGFGGMFPLVDPARDQRRVEIWYQMAAYLIASGV